MSESDQRGRVVDELRSLDAVAVENPAGPGTPDVNFIEGWIELKWAKDWPARAATKLTVDHFTKQQRVWMYRRHLKGGWIVLVLQVGREWFVLPPGWTVKHLGVDANREAIVENSLMHWPKGWAKGELLSWISQTKKS